MINEGTEMRLEVVDSGGKGGTSTDGVGDKKGVSFKNLLQ